MARDLESMYDKNLLDRHVTEIEETEDEREVQEHPYCNQHGGDTTFCFSCGICYRCESCDCVLDMMEER